MRPKRRPIFFTLALATCSVLLAAVEMQTLAMAQPKGKVLGKVGVFITEDTFVPRKATVILEGKHFKQQVQTDATGNYQISVPVGVYRITTEIPDHFPFRRAPFKVEPNDAIIINIVPLSRIRAIGLGISTSGKAFEPRVDTPAPRYDSFVVPYSAELPGELVIRFEERRKRKGVIEYTFASATYDSITVNADLIRYDPKRLRLIAMGVDLTLSEDKQPDEGVQRSLIEVEDGKQSVTVKRAEVLFKARRPIIKLIQ